jgi:hypothetical protein
MRPRQTAVIWAGTLLVVGIALYPPWVCVGARGAGLVAGYHWFFSPPEGNCLAANLDFPRLLIQWAVVGVLSAVLYLAWPTTFFAWISRVLKAFFRLVLIVTPLLILGAVALGLLYMGCIALQPWMASVLPAGWAPKSGQWLFFYLLLVTVFLLLFVRALADEMKDISGHPARRFMLGLAALAKGFVEGAKQRPGR